MKSLLLFLFLAFPSVIIAQQNSSSQLEVLRFKSQFLSFYANGEKEDVGEEINIAFFKNHVLFETPVLHHKGDDADGSTIEKITYFYYVYKKGQQKGLFYNEETGKVKYFSVDTLFELSNLGKLKEAFVSKDLGPAKETRRFAKEIYEKYYGFKKEDEIDSVFRHYDESLKGINFSISPKLDQEKQSKLVKSLAIVNFRNAVEDKNRPVKLEVLDEIERVTPKISLAQMEKFKRYFEKYQHDLVNFPISK